MNDFDSIRSVIGLYFDGLYEGDIDKLAGIFHKRSRLYVMADGSLSETELDAYLPIVKNRASPKSLNAERADEIVALYQTSSDTALAVVRLKLVEKSFTDQLVLMKDNGRWQIICKSYHLNSNSAVAT